MNINKCACILAAGSGSRLKKHTSDMTKCMVKVNGKPLIDHTMDILIESSFTTIFVVIGYKADHLKKHLSDKYPDLNLKFIYNSKFESTNNIYSLYLALEHLKGFDEVAVLESDIWVASEIANKFFSDPREDLVLVSPFRYWMDGTCVTLHNESSSIASFVSKADIYQYDIDKLYKTVNWYRFSSKFLFDVYFNFIESYVNSFGSDNYYEDVLKVIGSVKHEFFSSFIIQEKYWGEIDDEEDLSRVELLGSNPQSFIERFGGYWKYDFIEDLTLLVNPFFPSPGLKKELINQSSISLLEYPSKLSVIESIASKSLDCEPEHIVVGNGASELMMALFGIDNNEYAILPPFFMEYQRLLGDRLHIVDRNFPDEGVITKLQELSNLQGKDIILVNPNNPTGELVPKASVLSLLKRLKKENRRLVIDESFIDFTGDYDDSVFRRSLIEEFSNLVLIKSYGKSYGLPGLRLGVLATSDKILLRKIRSQIPLWNVSSVAEVFLDLLPRYKSEYRLALKSIVVERDYLERALDKLGLKVYASKANFVLFSLVTDPDHFSNFCFEKGVLIKALQDRPGLPGTYFRVAVRTRTENAKFIELVSEYVS